MERLLALFNQFSLLVKEAFVDDPRFLTARDKAYKHVVNDTSVFRLDLPTRLVNWTLNYETDSCKGALVLCQPSAALLASFEIALILGILLKFYLSHWDDYAVFISFFHNSLRSPWNLLRNVFSEFFLKAVYNFWLFCSDSYSLRIANDSWLITKVYIFKCGF